jgi:hypothetical protein
MNTSRQPAITPGSDSGKVIFQKAVHRRAAEVLRRLDQRIVHLLQCRIERQDHERQVGIDDADEDRRMVLRMTSGWSMMPWRAAAG